ncbi:translation initiation factor IF-2-like [Acinonyx jubatus]|uniref:Translation initiation factor IF-2-like n=1 Tax=Acinonyx jubatus TaxID=32536 RepID=A0ABM3P824_ACIJB|nr:translation initiation factor IF-2-like [Acinonyx jubatus]
MFLPPPSNLPKTKKNVKTTGPKGRGSAKPLLRPDRRLLARDWNPTPVDREPRGSAPGGLPAPTEPCRPPPRDGQPAVSRRRTPPLPLRPFRFLQFLAGPFRPPASVYLVSALGSEEETGKGTNTRPLEERAARPSYLPSRRACRSLAASPGGEAPSRDPSVAVVPFMGFQASRERFGFQAGCGNRRPASGLTSKPGRPQAGVRQRRRQSEPTSGGSDVRLRSTSNRGPRQTGSHLQLGPTSPWVLRQTGPQLRAGPTSAPVLPPPGSHLRLIPTSDRVLPPTRSHRQLGPTSHWVSPHAWVPPHAGSRLRLDPASDWVPYPPGSHIRQVRLHMGSQVETIGVTLCPT